MKKVTLIVLIGLIACAAVFAEAVSETNDKIEIKALILPKFESGEISGDFPGEAQLYYEAYCAGGEEYEIAGAFEGHKLYVKNGIALYVTGMGKVNVAISTQAILSDPRFDFSNAYIISTGCAGSAMDTTVMGDVFVITAAIDFDLGHHADVREMRDQSATTWFHDGSYDSSSIIKLNTELTDKIYEMVKDVKIETTPRTRNFMSAAFDGAEWAIRDPKVLKGTTVSADNYWKGIYDHNNALLMTQTYECADPYVTTEMEDVAVGVVCKRFGMLDRFIIIRDSVNMDVFMNGASPESLWDPNFVDSLSSGDSVEAADIFKTARYNNFAVGSVVIDAILAGTL